MKRLHLIFAIVALCLPLATSDCWAFRLPKAQQFGQTIGQAEVVAIFKIGSLDLKAKPIPKPSGPSGIFTGTTAFIAASTFEGEGTYQLITVRNIKGDAGADVTLKAPALTGLGYLSTFHVKVGDFLIALLRKDGNSWVPQDPMRPFVPLFVTPDLTTISDANPLQQVESLVIPELKDKSTRLLAADLLSNSKNSKVLVALAPYIEDSNLRVRDIVLTTFARNKQLNVINRIRDLNRLTSVQGSNLKGITELLNYSGMKEAVPFLNPLLFEAEQFIRINALDSLVQAKDASSIPFLLLTLHDPEPQKANAESAFGLLQGFTKNASSISLDNFRAQKIKATAEMIKWWQDELSGKRPVAEGEEQPRVTLRESNLYEAKDLPRLNEGLFMRSEFTRDAAIKALDKLADQSSIPYLLLAQYDPKPDIAFGAYKTLHRLIPELGPAKLRGTFDAGRETLAQQGFDWWTKSLVDAEKPPTSPAARPAAIAK